MGVSPNNSMVVGCCFFMLLIGVLATFYPWLDNKSCFMWEEGTCTNSSSPNKVYIARLFFCEKKHLKVFCNRQNNFSHH